VAAARVIEVVARRRRAPVLEDAPEVTRSDVGLDHALRQAGQAESGKRRVDHLRGTVENELALDAHVQLAPAFLELPCVQPAMARQAQVDAVVTMLSPISWNA
jgi:hypothetical protein